MENILNWLDTKYIDWAIFLLVIGSGFLQARLLQPFCFYKKDPRYDATLKTFLVSICLCTLYVWLCKYEAKMASAGERLEGTPWVKLFISYACATSFYEVILRLFKIEFKKKTGQDIDEITNDTKK